MLTAIEIQNYRGIREGRINGFGSVNLLVGPNGSGKSSILEAIFLGAYRRSIDFEFQGLRQNSSVPLVALRHNEDRFPSADLWYRKIPQSEITVNYKFDSSAGSFGIASSPDASTTSYSTSQSLPDSLTPFFKRMKLLDTRVLLDPTIEQRSWDQLLNARGDRELLKVMNTVYGLSLESLTYSAYIQRLKALFADRDYALNIDDLGAGMRIAFRMFIAILLSEESAVLAEEFDSYQHIECFPRFVKALIGVSARVRAQLFLATHSMETVRTFVEHAGANSPKADLRIFQTALSKDGFFEAASFTADDAEALISGGFDVRSTS